jgi:hypothetical protein
VFPIIAEVIGVANTVPSAWGDIVQLGRGRAAVPKLTVGHAVLAGRRLEDPHVIAFPAERLLDSLVQLLKRC